MSTQTKTVIHAGARLSVTGRALYLDERYLGVVEDDDLAAELAARFNAYPDLLACRDALGRLLTEGLQHAPAADAAWQRATGEAAAPPRGTNHQPDEEN